MPLKKIKIWKNEELNENHYEYAEIAEPTELIYFFCSLQETIICVRE